jgi:hypothetical protein
MKYTFAYTPVGSTTTKIEVLCGDTPRMSALAGPKSQSSGQIEVIEPIRGFAGIPVARGLSISSETFRAQKEHASYFAGVTYDRVTIKSMLGARGILSMEGSQGGRIRLINAVCVAANPVEIGILTIIDFTFTGSQWTV